MYEEVITQQAVMDDRLERAEAELEASIIDPQPLTDEDVRLARWINEQLQVRKYEQR